MPTTLDFYIRPNGKNVYSLDVFERSNTQPLAHGTFDYDLSYMTAFEINRLDVDEKDPQGRLERLQTFGVKLYAKLFPPAVQAIWHQYKDHSDFLELCLRIAPEASGLEVLPWETLYDGAEFLSAGVKTGLTRLPLEVPLLDHLPPLPQPLKMLAFMSSPLDLAEHERLQIEAEQELLLQAVNAPAGQGKLHLVFEDEAKLPILENALEGGYHIWHYSGHGLAPENGGGLLLEDADGKKRPAGIADLLQVLQKSEKTLRLVVISGCQTAATQHTAGFRDLARALAQRRIPAVMAIQFSITDKAGLLFAENLYPRLIDGQRLSVAMSACRRLLLYHDAAHIKADAFAPVLLLANDECLKTDQTVRTLGASGQSAPKIDFSFHLPLPQLSFGFYGRRREYRAIRDGLLHRHQRAIIIYGIGGIGKTALISHTAERLRKNFRGVYGFDCSGASLAPETIVLELHRYLERQGVTALQPLLHQSLPPEHLATYLGQVLSQWPLLLIFDNFETQLTCYQYAVTSDQFSVSSHQYSVAKMQTHVIADDNLRVFLTTLIKATATGSRFLFTTRYLFDLDAKRVGAIQEMPLHDLSRPEAVGLMQKLPHLAAASYDDKLQAFEKFGGHPYALVTLDRHCGHKPLAQTLADAAHVHAELRAFLAIEMSYSQLAERSRELLNRLAAFRKPVPYAAAEWVMGEKILLGAEVLQKIDRSELPDEWKNLDDTIILEKFSQLFSERRQAENLDRPIMELIGWGLLTPLNNDTQVNTLIVHCLVRNFCRGNQKRENWNAQLKDAAAFYINQTILLQQDDKTPAAVWNEMEAFEILMEAEEWWAASGLLTGTQELLIRWGFDRYLESQYRRLLDKVDRRALAAILHNLGVLLQTRGDYTEALAVYEKSLKINEETGGDRTRVASFFHQIGMIHQDSGDYAAALAEYEKSLKINEEIGDRAGIAKSLNQIGNIYYYRGDYATALANYEKSLKILEDLGHPTGVASYLHQIGNIHYVRGDYAAALIEYEKSLKIKEKIGDRAGIAESLHNIGAIHQARGDYAAALNEYEKSLTIAEELANRAGIAKSLHEIGRIHQARGNYAAALAEYEKSLKINEEIGSRADEPFTHSKIGQLFTQTGRYPEAFEHLFFALVTFLELQSPNYKIVAHMLKTLRAKWDAENFDAAWQQATGETVPEWFKE